jgi:hypothetical protein
MFEQKYYREMKVGEVYRCPPGGQVMLVLENTRSTNDGGHLVLLVLVAEGNVNWTGKEGMTVRQPYKTWSAGSWTRVL